MLKETKIKAVEDSGGESHFNLDGILSELGSFGKYQVMLLFLLAFRDSFLGMCNFNYLFTAADVAYRCRVPECELIDSSFNASWTSIALGNDSTTCHRPEPYTREMINESTADNVTTIPDLWNINEICTPESFLTNRTIPCDEIVYENYDSIVSEFNLGCEPWKRTMIGTIHNLGLVFSFILSGYISDRYGRKVIIVGTPLTVGICGLIKSFSVNYWMLLVFEFLETALGYGNAALVLSLESVSQKRRVVFSSIEDIMSSFGSAFFGLIAWKVPYWRYMMRAIYAPLLVVVFYIFLMDEGVRWLLAHNKKDEAVRVLNKVAKMNNITLSKNAKEMLTKMTQERKKADEVGQQPPEESHLISVLRSKKIVLRVALIAACFFAGMFVQYGAIVNSTTISGNKYVNFSVLLMVSIPTRVVSALTLTKFGRKRPISIAYCLCAVFLIASAAVPQSVSWASVLLYVLGKMCSSYGLFGISVVALETFPTTSRNSLTNIANTIGRFGSVLAPQTPLLVRYMDSLPSLIFGLVALGCATLTIMLPDTSRTVLPDDITEAEKIGEDTAQAVSEEDCTDEESSVR